MFDTHVLRTASEKALLLQGTLESDIPHFHRDVVSHRTYIAVFKEGNVVGLVGLVESSARVTNAMGVGFISTHRSHLRQGVAKALVEGLFKFALQERKAIANTSYEPDGLLWLKPLMASAAQRHPLVTLHER
jgi:GNAT superfamily N-acetyltransferase